MKRWSGATVADRQTLPTKQLHKERKSGERLGCWLALGFAYPLPYLPRNWLALAFAYPLP